MPIFQVKAFGEIVYKDSKKRNNYSEIIRYLKQFLVT